MSYIIDSSIWIDFFRARSSPSLKQQLARFINDERAMTCEPVVFELLRAASKTSRNKVEMQLMLLPIVPTPTRLWADAANIGQKCLGRGLTPPAMDLLIAQVCIANDVELLTFDQHFAGIARVTPLRTTLLDRMLK